MVVKLAVCGDVLERGLLEFVAALFVLMACPALQDESTGSSGVQGKAYQSGQVHIIKRCSQQIICPQRTSSLA